MSAARWLRMRSGALAVVVLAGVAGQAVGAQEPPPVRRDSAQRADTTKRPASPGAANLAAASDTTKKLLTRADTLRERADSIRKAQLAGLEIERRREITWVAEDSAMSALLGKEGYSITKYQGNSVEFRAAAREMFLLGKRAQVARDSTILVGDTITFNDSTQMIRARGDTLVLRDPAQGQDDVVSLRSLTYDISNRRGVVREVTTAVESGQRWIVHGNVAAFKGDTSRQAAPAFYAKNGWLTSCEEKEPHYHFAAGEMKMISKNVMVVRPAVLYIADIPVAWLPFVFNDMRPGRRSGLISPQISFTQVFRRSPFLRRQLNELGYYFAINDYVSSQVSLDWRSDARGTEADPGFLRLNTRLDYRWKERFLDGQLGVSMHYLRNGQVNRTYSLQHGQKFSERTGLQASINYTENTQIQRQTTFNPVQALQTIRSTASFRTGRGPLSMDIGGTQTQYPGRDQIDRSFPGLRISSKPIEVGEWLTWTPGFTLENSESLNIDQVGDFAYRYVARPSGGYDSVKIRRNTRNSSISFDTPVQIRGFNWRNAFRVSDVAVDFPERRRIYPDPRDTSRFEDRVFARTYRTGMDWETSFNLPSFGQNRFNITPTMSIQKVDGRSPLIVRTERTAGKFVTQGLRPSFGLSMAPKVYGFFPGFGQIEAIRHVIEPTVSWSYTPRGKVSDEFLAANGDVAVGFLGALPQNQISLGFGTWFEAKLRAPERPAGPVAPVDSEAVADSTRADSTERRPTNRLQIGSSGAQQPEGRKVKLLALNFTTLSYDFVRAKESSGGTGLSNRTFDWGARSDLLPGFEFGMNYSLFLGDPISDTAVFKPYREGIRTSMNLDANSPIVRGLARLVGIRLADSATLARQNAARQRQQTQQRQGGDGVGGRGSARDNSNFLAGRSLAGGMRGTGMQGGGGQGWRINLSYTGTRQRPPRGDSTTVRDFDPRDQCRLYRDDPFQEQLCLNQFATGGVPTTGRPFEETTRGATLFRMPPQANINGSMSFNVTNLWAAQWQTSYDVERKEFAQHVVQLRREMHDWDAVFSFTRAPNGNFAFSFFMSLRAQPDIKIDYDRPSFPRGYTGRRQF